MNKETNKKWYVKIWKFIKNLFNKFEFDNNLFALGVDYVANETIELLTNEYNGEKVESIIKNFSHNFELKFKNYKRITSLIEEAKTDIIEIVKNKRGYLQMKTENKIKFIAEEIKIWYNKYI